MKKFLARLNSTERRFVVGVFVVVFIVVNILFIWPRFKDWEKVKVQINKGQNNLQAFQKEIGQKATYEKLVRELEGEDAVVPPEDQITEFLRTLQFQASRSGITFDINQPQPTVTNQFFLERAQSLGFKSGEPQLVDFLYNLGTGASLIRVRAITLRPADANRYQLSANVTLVASFQKKVAARAPVKTADAKASVPAAATAKTQPPNRKRP